MYFRSRKTNNMGHADNICERCSSVLSLGTILILSNLQAVDKDSATIDGSNHIGFETDHRNMQRFSNREDEDYKNIVGWIRKWTEKAQKEADGKCR